MSLQDSLGLGDDRVVAIYPALRKIVVPLPDLILISQILFWAKVKNPFYKTNLSLSYETGLTKNEVEYIKKRLHNYPFIKISFRGIPRKTYYKIDWNILHKMLNESEDIKNVAQSEDGKLIWGKSGKRTSKSGKIHISPHKTKNTVDDGELPLVYSGQNPEDDDDRLMDYRTNNSEDGDDRPLVASGHRLQDNGTHRPQAYENDRPLYRDKTEIKTEIKTENIIVANEIKRDTESPRSASPFEDKPQNADANSKYKKIEYPVGFETIWSKYKPRHTKSKGSKANAYKAYAKVLEKFTDEEIEQLIEDYMDSSMFMLGQAHLSTFLNGLITDSKYREEFVEGGYAKRLAKVKNINRYKTSAQESYRQDIAKQGELNTNDLIDRSAYISVMLTVKYGLMMNSIENGDRKEWLPYLGPEYVAVPIKHPLSKTDKIKVLFHIDELRSNQYVHLHGHEWSEEQERRYQESNKGVEWVNHLPLPNKEEYK